MKKKKWPRILGIIVSVLILIVVVIVMYIVWFLPSIPLKEIRVEITPQRVERGKYLANHVTVCMDCHSTRDWSKFSGPMVEGTLGRGGEIFDQKMGFPGSFRSPNITPFHLKSWSDAEIYRAITSGVSKDGHPLFPIMPYPAYSTLDTEDIFSLIAYIRGITPVDFTPPRSDPAFPMNIVLHLFPAKASPSARPASTDTVKYGEYLVRASGCIECHTPAEHGQIDRKFAFSGGRDFEMPDGILTSPNITPDPETGIGNWTEEVFIARFKSYDPATHPVTEVKKGEIQSIMPWTMYAGMDSTDLKAVYRYLKSLPPVSHKVVKRRPLM
jgi:mono/diheme cytochrome c family protein